MGRRGPQKKPRHIKELQGFPGKQRGQKKALAPAALPVVDSPSVQPADVPAFPVDLSGKVEREIWRQVWSAPDARHRLRDTDVGIIVRYCQNRATAREVRRLKIEATIEHTDTTGNKVIRRNPKMVQLIALEREIRTDEILLGLNPRARLDINSRLADQPPSLPNRQPTGPDPSQPSTATAASDPRTRSAPASPIGLLAGNSSSDRTKH